MRAKLFAMTGLGLLAQVGCTIILGVQKDYTTGEPGAGGGGGAPGGASSTGSSAAASTSGSSPAASTGGSSTSGSSTSGSSTGSGGASSSSGAGGALACPTGPGPAMVALGAFCIDATEVTNGDYAAWLATNPSTAMQPPGCGFNVSFVPAGGWPALPADADKPVSRVDWCDAHAYCAGVGKRLCGRIGGGALAFDAFADPAQSEWMAACSNGGTTAYPYGGGYVPASCDGKDAKLLQTVAVGSEAQCHGPSGAYASIFDLSGNVAEWEDACSGASGPNDTCRRRGGSYKDTSMALGCASEPGNTPKSFTSSTTGFRCCAP